MNELFGVSDCHSLLSRDEVGDGVNDELAPAVGDQVQLGVLDLLGQQLVQLVAHLLQQFGHPVAKFKVKSNPLNELPNNGSIGLIVQDLPGPIVLR